VKFGMTLAIGFAALTMAACGPTYVGMGVGPPPPRPVVAYRPAAPGYGYVWTDGYWDLRGDRWHWMEGRWAKPPRPHARWESGYWAPRNGRYRWHPGRWR